MIRAGVIGVGYLGQHHARIYSQIEGVTLAGVLDASPERAAEIAAKFGCAPYDDLEKLLADTDALSIVTPTPLHYDIALRCIRAGKDLLVEKPVTVTIAEADSLIDEAARRDLILQVGHLERYNPAVVALGEHLGHPVFFEAERMSPFLDRAAGVDITLDLMIHDIDIILSLERSRPRYIKAVGASVLSDNIDVAKAWIDFESGASALISAARLSAGKVRRLKIFQRDSHIILDYQNAEIKRYFKSGAREMKSEVYTPQKREPLMEEIKDFIRCVQTRSRPLVSGIEAREALRVALDITYQLKRSSVL